MKDWSKKNSTCRNFPDGSVVKNSLFCAGDMGLIPGQGAQIPHTVLHPLSLQLGRSLRSAMKGQGGSAKTQCNQISK